MAAVPNLVWEVWGFTNQVACSMVLSAQEETGCVTEKALRAGPEWASSQATPRFTLLVFAPIAAWLFCVRLCGIHLQDQGPCAAP